MNSLFQATLGLGTAITKSTLQCNVGNKSPVYLCSLYPGKTESLQLNLELEEDGNVIFSVIGPRSIHLCGYYLARGRYSNTLDESYPYLFVLFPVFITPYFLFINS
jgi:FK506-binding nuclear protein